MKKFVPALALVAMFAFAAASFAAKEAAKEVTLSGEAVCGKCTLKEADKCNCLLKVKEDGKEVIYVVKGHVKHKEDGFCQGPKAVKVTGVVSEKDGKKIITASKVE